MRVLGFEPRTSALSELRSSQLSYTRSKPGQQKSQTSKGLALSGPDYWIERQISLRLLRIRLVMNTLPSAVTGKPTFPWRVLLWGNYKANTQSVNCENKEFSASPPAR